MGQDFFDIEHKTLIETIHERSKFNLTPFTLYLARPWCTVCPRSLVRLYIVSRYTKQIGQDFLNNQYRCFAPVSFHAFHEAPWYLYKMVAQIMLRTWSGSLPKKIGFEDSVDVTANAFKKSNTCLIYSIRAHSVLSYHLIYVAW